MQETAGGKEKHGFSSGEEKNRDSVAKQKRDGKKIKYCKYIKVGSVKITQMVFFISHEGNLRKKC